MSIIVGEGMVKGNMDARMNGYPDGRRERNVSLSGRFRLVESAAVLRFFGAVSGWKNQVPAVSKTHPGSDSFPAVVRISNPHLSANVFTARITA